MINPLTLPIDLRSSKQNYFLLCFKYFMYHSEGAKKKKNNLKMTTAHAVRLAKINKAINVYISVNTLYIQMENVSRKTRLECVLMPSVNRWT